MIDLYVDYTIASLKQLHSKQQHILHNSIIYNYIYNYTNNKWIFLIEFTSFKYLKQK